MNQARRWTRRCLLAHAGAALLTGPRIGRLLAQEDGKVPTVRERLQRDAEEAPLALRFRAAPRRAPDTLIAPRQAEEARSPIRRAYRALGAEDRLLVDRFEGGHGWHGRAAYELPERVLRAPMDHS